MRRKGMTVKDATYEWVQEMNAIQQGMIAKLMEYTPEDWTEVTTPSSGDRVYVYGSDFENGHGEIAGYDEETETYIIEMDGGGEINATTDDFEVERDDGLPMWGTMWSFGDSADDYWLENEDGIRIMSECGFRVFESSEFGYFFGIDGAGYSFYDAHWIPLYRARGFQWHDPDTEKQEAAA